MQAVNETPILYCYGLSGENVKEGFVNGGVTKLEEFVAWVFRNNGGWTLDRGRNRLNNG
jgi:hypothetical protein